MSLSHHFRSSGYPFLISTNMIIAPSLDDEDRAEEEEAQEIRQRAYDLLNRMGKPEEEDAQEWPENPQVASRPTTTYSSYQQGQATGEGTSPMAHNGGRRNSLSGNRDSLGSLNSPSGLHPSSSASSSVVDIFVRCVSDACKTASSEILNHQGAILWSGYESIRSVVAPEVEERWFAANRSYDSVSGNYQNVDVGAGYQGRYSDREDDMN